MFPDVSDAFWEWTDPVTLKVVTTAVADFEVTETAIAEETFQGVLQPIPPQKLLVKPEGMRTWKWWYVWTKQVLEPQSVLEDAAGKQYRVMQKSDWESGGHFQYELVQDPPLES